jgi:AcrR family transcriptional regulator
MKKGDAKRQAILNTAYKLFRAQGFDNTSISQITTEVGGSKATIYSHFPSKEELFVECMTSTAEAFVKNALALLDTAGEDPHAVLREFGFSLLSFICAPDLVEDRRLLIAEAHRAGIGKMYFAKIAELRAHVAAFLFQLMQSGVLRHDDPQLAADHLRGLLEAGILEPLLLHARERFPDEKEITLAADRSVALFLRAYAPAGQ